MLASEICLSRVPNIYQTHNAIKFFFIRVQQSRARACVYVRMRACMCACMREKHQSAVQHISNVIPAGGANNLRDATD